jgi:hypothetical protein
LYKEWEEHFNNDITELEIVTVIDLTTIWHIVTHKVEEVCHSLQNKVTL